MFRMAVRDSESVEELLKIKGLIKKGITLRYHNQNLINNPRPEFFAVVQV